MEGIIKKGAIANQAIIDGLDYCVTCYKKLSGLGISEMINHEGHHLVKLRSAVEEIHEKTGNGSPSLLELHSWMFGIENNANCTTCTEDDMDTKIEIDALAFQEGAEFVLNQLKKWKYVNPTGYKSWVHFNNRVDNFVENVTKQD